MSTNLHSKNEIRVGLKFDADTSQFDISRQKFKELISYLKEMQNEARKPGLGGQIQKELSEAAQEAKKLETILNSAWNDKINKMDFSKLNLGIKQAYGSMSQLKANFESIGPEGATAFNQLSNSILSSNTQLRKTNSLLDKMSLTMANTIRFGISSSIFNTFTSSVSKAYDYVKKLDKSLNDIRIVSNASAADMEKFAKYANASAQKLGANTLDYTKAALIYYQQGLEEEQVKLRSDITVKMSNVLGTSAQEVSEYMTAIWNNFAKGGENLEYFADVLAKLGAETASSAEEISQGLEKFSAVADAVGLSYEYAAAALTTVTDRTRQSADVVGTAFKTLFARIQDLELGDEGTVTIGKYAEALEKFDIHVLDSQGNLKKMDEILGEMGSKWQTMSNAQKVALAQNVAGVRQYTQLMSLMENWDFFEQNVDSARNATGSLQKQQEIYLDSVEARLEQLQAEAEKAYATLFDTKVIKSFTDALTAMLKVFNSFLTGLGGGMNNIAYFGSVAGNLLSKQIGSGISGRIQNKENKKYNAALLETQKETAEAGASMMGIESENTKAAYNQNAEDIKLLLEAQKVLNEDEYNQLDQLRKDIQEERLAIAQIQDFGNNSTENSDQREAKLLRTKSQIKENIEDYERIEELIKEINDIEVVYQEELDERKDKIQELVALMEEFSGTINEENLEIFDISEVKELDKIKTKVANLSNKEKITQQDIETILKGQNKVLTANVNSEKKQAQELKMQKQFEDKVTLAKREQQNEEKESNYIMQAGEKARANIIAERIRGITTITSSLSAMVGVVETIFNPDLTGWEKIKSISAVMVAQVGMIASNWNDVKDLGKDLALWVSKRVAAIEAENAAKAKGLIMDKASTAQEATKLGLQQAETQEKVTQNALTLKDTLLGIVRIAQQGVIDVLKAIEAVLTGQIVTASAQSLAIGVAVIAALAVGVGLLGKWVIDTIKANTEQAKLQRKVEETAEAVQQAKDAYKELSDSISSYKDARSGIDGLTEGTIEFYDAVMKSNEAAQQLIDKLGLMAGTDYTIDANGLITIDEDRLSDKMFEEQQKVYQAQSRSSQARYNLAKYNKDQTVKNFQQTINTKDGLGGGFSRAQAESILDRSHQKNELMSEDAEGNKIGTSQMKLSEWEDVKSTFKQGLDNIASNELATTAAVLHPIGTLTTAFLQEASVEAETKDGIIDITEEVGEFRAEYNKYSAEMLALERETSLANIRAYGSKENVEAFNKMNSTQQNILADFTTKQRQSNEKEEKSGWASFWDTSDKGFWGKLGIGSLKALGYGISAGIGGPAGVAAWNKATTSDQPSDLELKETYGEKVLGYTKDSKGRWRNSAGEKVDIKDVDLDAAKEAYASGEYEAGERADKLITKIGEIKTAVGQQGFDQDSQDYIAEAFTAIMTGDQNYDFNTLTEKEMDAVAEQIQANHDYFMETYKAYNDEAQDDMRYAMGNFNVARLGSGAEKTDEERDKQARAREARDLKNYNEQMDASAKSLGTSSAALKVYDAALQTANKGTVKYTNSTAEAAAASYKFNKTYNEGRKVFKDNKKAWDTYTKALKQGKQISYDVADGAGAIIESLEGMGIELNTKDLKDPKTLKNINKLLSGTEKEAKAAYKALKEQSWMSDLTKNFGLTETAAKSFIDSLNKAKEGKPFKISDSVLEEMNKSTKTLEDWKKWAEKYNLNIDVKTNVKQKATEFNPPTEDTVTRHTIETYTDSDGNKHPGYTYTERVSTAKPTLYSLGDLNFTKKSGNTNFKSSSTGGGKSGGGSSKKKEAKVKSDVDIYHKVNTQIAKVDSSLKKLQRQEEKVLGTKLINNLQKQWENLNSQVKNYGDKLEIAQGEYNKLRKSLEKQGVKFNDDGTVSNYFEIIKQKEKELNNFITKYNKMSAKQQKKNQKKLDKMKKEYEELTANLDRVDTLISSEIPEIKEALNSALDEQVELNIKAFDLEVNLSLDLKDAKKAWNDFKHKIINGVRDEDILGNANLVRNNLAANLNTTTENGKTVWGGDLISQTQHVTEIMREIKLQEQGLANVFGNDTAAAYDALKEAIDRARESYEEVVEYQKELHESYLNMLDQAKDKLDKQKESYEQIGSLLEHNKRIIELTHGEKAYALLEKYYTLQKENNKNQLVTLRQQQEYYEKQLLAAKAEKETAAAALERATEGTDEWETLNNKYLETIEKFEKTKEHWNEAVQASNDALESSIEFAQESLENTINKIVTTINQELTGKTAGLDHAEEEWDLINKNADQYLDKINRLQGENELESKYMNSIDKATNPNTQRKIKAAMDAELKALRDKDKLTQYDLDRANKKYQITLAQIALEEAQQNKTQMRLRRDSQGNYRYQYVADEDSIKKAKEELSSLYTDLYNFDKERYKTTLSEIESITKEFEEKMAEVAKINDPQEREERELLLKEQYSALLTEVQREGETARRNVIDSAFDDLSLLENKHKDEYLAMTNEETDALMKGLIPAWDSVYAKIQQTIAPSAFVTQLLNKYRQAWENAQTEIQDYKDIIYEDTDSVEDFKDQNKDIAESLVEDNEKLIQQYEENFMTLSDMIGATDELIEKYKKEYGGVKALETAYAALEAQMQKNLNIYDKYANKPGMITSANEQDQAEENEGVENKDKITDIVTPEAFLNNGIARNTLQAYLKDNGYGAEDANLITRIKAFQAFLGIPDSGYWDETTYKEAKRRGFDTGGYTGQWGSNNGKLAFLHQKELVLNPEDTVNILNTVALMRELAQWVGQSVFNRLAGVSAGSIGNFENSSTTLDQNVHIEATFPNVTNSNEIEEALKNLVNVASQRITK